MQHRHTLMHSICLEPSVREQEMATVIASAAVSSTSVRPMSWSWSMTTACAQHSELAQQPGSPRPQDTPGLARPMARCPWQAVHACAEHRHVRARLDQLSTPLQAACTHGCARGEGWSTHLPPIIGWQLQRAQGLQRWEHAVFELGKHAPAVVEAVHNSVLVVQAAGGAGFKQSWGRTRCCSLPGVQDACACDPRAGTLQDQCIAATVEAQARRDEAALRRLSGITAQAPVGVS